MGQLSPALVIGDTALAAEAEVDFTNYDVIYVAVPPGIGTTSFASSSAAFAVDGVRVTRSVLLTNSSRDTLIHETGHVMGLPDLYDATGTDLDRLGRFVGGWDIMSSGGGARSAVLLAWHRWKLGWLDAPQVRCVGSGTVEETIVPLTSTRAGQGR